MRLGVAQAVVGPAIIPGDVVVAGGRIAALGATPAGASGTAAPGFVDLQVNGFGGVDFLTSDPAGWRRAARAIAATGVTAYQPTFVTAPPEDLRRALEVAAAVTDPPEALPRLLGVHLEGPFLSPRWPGAHPPQHLRPPDLALVEELRAAGPVSHVTLAPELPGALELIAALAARGVTVAIGHTDAGAATCRAAFDRGARALTHVHNAHRRFAARDPGPAGAALAHPAVTVTAIVDGHHLAPETAAIAWRAAGRRFALVTDAIAAARPATGGGTSVRTGPRASAIAGRMVAVGPAGDARLPDGRLAGSTLTMDAAVRGLCALGATLPEAVHAAARAPALLAGRPELGLLAVGAPADVVVLDDALSVRRVLLSGREAAAG
ncbi:N-acetylglucosamine-6-phosphate deacetylase [Capillimicrobium parvum]|uniref:N-acetylgalactosamine-6-phosphate deacetylase n=1 Tax=Capillimicrobium parvum TaxID=2884022 RepID=A0A9E6XUR4_9ACTN|nr:amidohydrolase family protein [Capillimicrobium parvum]UGS34788.1 N-acetylgalactosamine-6-phosphate deacetylase [Capillimicrobium parvum]